MMGNGTILAGFDRYLFKGFEEAGHRPSVWLQSGRWLRNARNIERPEGVETWFWGDINRGIFPNVFNMEMDEAVLNEVLLIALEPFEKCYFRTNFTREDISGDWSDRNNSFMLGLYFFYDMILRHNIRQVIFSNIPHEGPIIILYYLCQSLNIETIMMTQSLFTNKFFIFKRIEDFGFFETGCPREREALTYDHEPKPLFYMKNTTKMAALYYRKKLLVDYLKLSIKTGVRALGLNKRQFKKNKHRVKNLSGQYYIQNHPIVTSFDRNRKYIYFPLQLQPEMTTDIIGDQYCDQLLAVERLYRHLPDDWCIYLKENPKQTAYCRDESFYRRIRMLDRVHYISIETNTFELIEHAQFVMTITGTAGWEAIRMNKPVLIFGEAWYRLFPGVFEWRNGFDLQKIIECKINAIDIEEAVLELSRYLYNGIVDDEYFALLENYDPQENGQRTSLEIIDFISNSLSK